MSNFSNLLNKAIEQMKAKKYVGLLSNSLPILNTNWSKGDFLKANEISLYLNRALSKRAEKVSEIEFVLKDKNDKEILNDPLFDLLYKPNKVFDGPQFWGLWQKYYDIIGETYIYKEKAKGGFGVKSKVIGLHLLRPDLVEKVADEANPGTFKEFIYHTGNKDITYQADEIMYRHNPNPSSPLSGMSIVQAGITTILTETQINEYHARVIKNGGKIEGVFNFKTGSLTASQLAELKDQYKKEYAGASKTGIPLFLGGDAEYIKTGLTPTELSFLETKKMTLDDISIMTGVPKTILGSFDDIKFSNADSSVAIFLRETIKPLLSNLTSMLDENFFPDDRFLTFIDPTPENIEEKLKETESGIDNYYMTINEARERHGLDPVKDGDDILIPNNLVPLGTDMSKGDEQKKSKSIIHPNTKSETRNLWWEMQIKRMDVREKRFLRVLSKYLAEQEKRIVEALKPTKMRVFRKEGLENDVFNQKIELTLGMDEFMPLLTDMLKDAGLDAMKFAGSEYQFNLSADIVSHLNTRTNLFLQQINETTFNTLKNQFSESLGANESRTDLIKRVRNTYGDITEGRGATIARTEVHNVTQYATLEGYKQAGMNIKIWASVRDSHTRDSHASLDGEERPINVPFSNGLMFPGDPNGSAEEVINCRCVI